MESKKKRILVTGGAGYIGTHLVDILLKENYLVRIYDSFVFGKLPIRDLIKNKNLEIVKGNMDELSKLIDAFQDVDYVVHLAGLVGDPACAVNSKLTLKTNIISTQVIKDLAKTFKIKKFIFASSCSVYGSSDNVVNELSDLNPVSLYAQTKIDSEKEILNDKSEDLHPIILRFATVYGHSRRPRFDLVTNFFTAQAYNDGVITVTGSNQWRPFIYVGDIARAIFLIIKAPSNVVERQIFNVGDNNLNITIGKLADLVKSVVKKSKKGNDVEIQVKDVVSDKRNYNVSFDKIKKILNFEAKTDLKRGIEEMHQAFINKTYKKNYKDKIYSNVEMTKLLSIASVKNGSK